MKITDLSEGDLVIIRRSGRSCDCGVCFFSKSSYPKSGKEYSAEVAGINMETSKVYLLVPKFKGSLNWNGSKAKSLKLPKMKQLQHGLDEFNPQAIVRKIEGSW